MTPRPLRADGLAISLPSLSGHKEPVERGHGETAKEIEAPRSCTRAKDTPATSSNSNALASHFTDGVPSSSKQYAEIMAQGDAQASSSDSGEESSADEKTTNPPPSPRQSRHNSVDLWETDQGPDGACNTRSSPATYSGSSSRLATPIFGSPSLMRHGDVAARLRSASLAGVREEDDEEEQRYFKLCYGDGRERGLRDSLSAGERSYFNGFLLDDVLLERAAGAVMGRSAASSTQNSKPWLDRAEEEVLTVCRSAAAGHPQPGIPRKGRRRRKCHGARRRPSAAVDNCESGWEYAAGNDELMYASYKSVGTSAESGWHLNRGRTRHLGQITGRESVESRENQTLSCHQSPSLSHIAVLASLVTFSLDQRVEVAEDVSQQVSQQRQHAWVRSREISGCGTLTLSVRCLKFLCPSA